MHSVSRFRSYHSLQTAIHVRQMPYPSSDLPVLYLLLSSYPRQVRLLPPAEMRILCIHRIHLSAVPESLPHRSAMSHVRHVRMHAYVRHAWTCKCFPLFLPVEAHLYPPAAKHFSLALSSPEVLRSDHIHRQHVLLS